MPICTEGGNSPPHCTLHPPFASPFGLLGPLDDADDPTALPAPGEPPLSRAVPPPSRPPLAPPTPSLGRLSMAGVAGVAGVAGAFGPALLRPFGGVAGSSCLRFSTITRAGRSPCGVGGSSSSVTSTSSSSASRSADTAPVDMVGERRGGCCGVHVCGVLTRKGSDVPLSPERRPAPMSSPVSPRSSTSTAVSSRAGPGGEAIFASTPGLSARARDWRRRCFRGTLPARS